ncbi:DUF4326 domain-containing protein [Micromonospora craterilacus]|uniref:DUF4326 domain-containing protein n=1 Tax=Micromonospora craterilacus TaxID=1655439 RepID=UPI0013145C31|nr:DUF4326 domain-containing protein [Micromonospora craterilacus]
MIPYAPDAWNEIIPGLFMGGHDRLATPGEHPPAVDVVVGDEFDVVISLYRRWGSGPAAGVEHHYLNIPDGALLPADARRCAELAGIAAAAVRAGRRALIRCQAGYNRSGLVTALTLIRLGRTAGEAIDLIQARRSPYALFNGHFVEHLLTVPRRIHWNRYAGKPLPPNARLITRPGRYSNPFKIGSLVIEPGWHGRCACPYDGTHPAGTRIGDKVIRAVRDRADAVALFRAWVKWNDDVWTPEFVAPLAGYDLACTCPAGEPCHGDVLLPMANGGEGR